MRTLLVVVVLIALMVAGGWLVFNYRGGTASVEFRTDEAKKDVEKVIDDTSTLIQDMRHRDTDPSTTIENRPLSPN